MLHVFTPLNKCINLLMANYLQILHLEQSIGKDGETVRCSACQVQFFYVVVHDEHKNLIKLPDFRLIIESKLIKWLTQEVE